MLQYEKCTWIHKSAIGAPTFKAAEAATGVKLALTWDLHYAEYSDAATDSMPA